MHIIIILSDYLLLTIYFDCPINFLSRCYNQRSFQYELIENPFQ